MLTNQDARPTLIPPRLLDVGMSVVFQGGPLAVIEVLEPGVLFAMEDGSVRHFALFPALPVVLPGDA